MGDRDWPECALRDEVARLRREAFEQHTRANSARNMAALWKRLAKRYRGRRYAERFWYEQCQRQTRRAVRAEDLLRAALPIVRAAESVLDGRKLSRERTPFYDECPYDALEGLSVAVRSAPPALLKLAQDYGSGSSPPPSAAQLERRCGTCRHYAHEYEHAQCLVSPGAGWVRPGECCEDYQPRKPEPERRCGTCATCAHAYLASTGTGIYCPNKKYNVRAIETCPDWLPRKPEQGEEGT